MAQDKFSFPMALGQRLRAYSKAHGFKSNADGLRQLLDHADIRDVLERSITALESFEGNNKGVSDCHQTETQDDTPTSTPEPSPVRLMKYGKYRGKPVTDIIKDDPDYIAYMLSQANSGYSNPFALTPSEQDLYDRIKPNKL